MNEQTRLLLQQLAEKLGTTTAHMWEILVRQAYVSFATDMLLYAMWLTFLWYSWRNVPKWLKKAEEWKKAEADKKKEDRYYSSGTDIEFIYQAVSVMAVVMCFVFTLISCLNIPDSIGKIANPEYWALQQLINAVTK